MILDYFILSQWQCCYDYENTHFPPNVNISDSNNNQFPNSCISVFISFFSKKYSQLTDVPFFSTTPLHSSVLFYLEVSDSHCELIQSLWSASLHSWGIVCLFMSSSYVEGSPYLCASFKNKKSDQLSRINKHFSTLIN